MRIAQITDSHCRAPGELWKGRVDMAAQLERAVEKLNRLDPDLVIHTGDVADAGEAAQYGAAQEILSGLKAPLRLIPGNHDLRGLMRSHFPMGVPGGEGFLHFAEEAEGLLILGLDTVAEHETAGMFCAKRAAWLRERLAGDRPALVFAHHPPCPMGLPFMDRFVFRGSELVAEAVLGRPVLRIATGHVHAAAERHWAGTLASACPATGVQIPPERAMAPPGFVLEPAVIRLHDWSPEMGLTVKTVPVEDFAFHPFETDPKADFNRP